MLENAETSHVTQSGQTRGIGFPWAGFWLLGGVWGHIFRVTSRLQPLPHRTSQGWCTGMDQGGPSALRQVEKLFNEEPELHLSAPKHLPTAIRVGADLLFSLRQSRKLPAAISWGNTCPWSQLASQIQVCIQSKRLLMRIRSLLISCC